MASSNKTPGVVPPKAYDQGIELRKTVLGAKHVEASLAKGTTEYWGPAQEFVTEVGWGTVWARPGLERKQRSLLNIAFLIALKSWHELGVHTKGAINNGLTELEIREAVLQSMVYCGCPAGLEAMRVTEKAIKEMVDAGEHQPELI